MKNYYLYGLVCLMLCLFTTTHATAQKSKTSKAYKKAQKKKKQQERRAKLEQYLGTPNTTQRTPTVDVRRNQKSQQTVDVRRNKRNTPSAKTTPKRSTPTKKTSKKRGAKNYQQVQVIDNAKVYLGTPYQWGGNGRKGFDCSGLTQAVFKKAGYNLPRTAQEQSRSGRKISLSKVEKGDLVFFGKRNKITHVGIVVSGKREPLRIIHSTSSEGVTITNVNESKYWKKRLKKAVRVIG